MRRQWQEFGLGHHGKLADGKEKGACDDDTTSLVTMAAVAPDKLRGRIKGQAALERLRDREPMFERMTALVLMTVNTFAAGVMLSMVVSIKGLWQLGDCVRWIVNYGGTRPVGAFPLAQLCDGAAWIITAVVVLMTLILLYLEYWRLWYARNLIYKLGVDAAEKDSAP